MIRASTVPDTECRGPLSGLCGFASAGIPADGREHGTDRLSAAGIISYGRGLRRSVTAGVRAGRPISALWPEPATPAARNYTVFAAVNFFVRRGKSAMPPGLTVSTPPSRLVARPPAASEFRCGSEWSVARCCVQD